MGSPPGSTGPDPQGTPPTDASASAGPSPTGHPSGPQPSGERKSAGAAWDELRQAVGAEEPVDDEVEGAESADPELIAEAERIADEALAEAKAKEKAEAADRRAQAAEAQSQQAEVAVQEADALAAEAERAVLEDLSKLAAERDDYLEQLRRVTADFDNYRKRILKQQTEHLERAAEGLVEKLLDVLDTFDLALAHGEGFEQVHGALVGVLEKEGLERIDPKGQPFDPNEADAVAHEDADDGPVVADVLRAGYRWKGRVLRPAMVKVRG
jgi:molecular chaperone GrpE